jgi:hypothetical protein
MHTQIFLLIKQWGVYAEAWKSKPKESQMVDQIYIAVLFFFLLTFWLFLDLDWNQAQPMPAATLLWRKAG